MKTSLKTVLAAVAVVGSLTLTGCAPAAEIPQLTTQHLLA